MFKHYIQTKFNVGIYKRKNAEEWMAHRINLFERFTYPSVMNQTVSNFTWLVRFDERTPEEVYKKYNIVPVFTNFIEYIRTIKSQWIITSRLDSDDYYMPTFVEKIQGCFREREEVIDPFGVKYYTKTDEVVHAHKLAGSAFISLVEKWEGAKTVGQLAHRKMPQRYPFRRLPERLYGQVIHDRNILNG